MDSVRLRGQGRTGERLAELAGREGTPLFVYHDEVAIERVRHTRAAFEREIELLFALKANPFAALFSRLLPVLDGVDVSSMRELCLALETGASAESLSFTGPAKGPEALSLAVARSIGAVCVESADEIDELAACARAVGQTVGIRLRINPPQPILAYAIGIGGRPSPFGIDMEDVGSAAERLRRHAAQLRYLGPHWFAGAQCLSARALARHIELSLVLTRELEREHGLAGDSINLGGGFGVPVSAHHAPLDLGALGERAEQLFVEHERIVGRPQRFCFELGRYLVAPAGVFIASVRRVKRSRGKLFGILDGGINCFLAAGGVFGPAGWSHVENLSRTGPRAAVQLVGPLCTPADELARDAQIGEPQPGDLIAFFNAGAYGPSASLGDFIGHKRAAETLLSAQPSVDQGEENGI